MNKFCLCYTTLPDKEKATEFGATLVRERLIACANIIENMTAVYFWKDALQTESECVVLLKTDEHTYPALAKRVSELHPYETPCLIRLTVSDVNRSYMDWISAALKR